MNRNARHRAGDALNAQLPQKCSVWAMLLFIFSGGEDGNFNPLVRDQQDHPIIGDEQHARHRSMI